MAVRGSLAVLRHELGGLDWPTLKKRIWLNLPRSSHTGKPRKVLFLWALPAFAANGLENMPQKISSSTTSGSRICMISANAKGNMANACTW